MEFRCQYQYQYQYQYQMRIRKTSEMLMRILQDDYTANNFGQQESRDGYSAQGEYFVNLPDGRLQKVKICHKNHL